MAIPWIKFRTARRVGRAESNHVLTRTNDKGVASHHAVGSIRNGKSPERMFERAGLVDARAGIRSIRCPGALGARSSVGTDIISGCLGGSGKAGQKENCGKRCKKNIFARHIFFSAGIILTPAFKAT